MKQGFDDYHDYLKRLVSRKREREKIISKRQTNRKITLPKPFFNQLSKKENAKVAREKKHRHRREPERGKRIQVEVALILLVAVL